jgi:hypothetical protein
MSSKPEPPPEGWSLREAAAALFPREWTMASLPDDDQEARSHPGITPGDDPLATVPVERIGLIMSGAHFGVTAADIELRADDLPIIERYRAFEAETARRLAEARKAATRARESLPQAFAERMIRGDLVAYGIDPRARADAPPTIIRPHLWAVARPHFGFDPCSVWHDHNGRPRMGAAPEPDSVSELPGGAIFRGVRIRTSEAASANAGSSDLLRVTTNPLPLDAGAVAGSPSQSPDDDAPRNKGGRPKRDDWPLFNREAFRCVALDGGNLTAREFRKRMTEWAEENMTPPPDESTIKRYIDRNFDTSVFAPE